jgi:hypothetical protein
MRELGRVFKAYSSEKHTTWLSMLPHLMQWINLTTHESTGVTPYQLQFGRKPVSEISRLISWPDSYKQEPSAETIIIQARGRLEKRAEARKAAAEGVGKHHVFKVVDLVLVRSHHFSSAANKEMSKFFHVFEGPFRVMKITGPNAYLIGTVIDGISKGTQNIKNLKPYISST